MTPWRQLVSSTYRRCWFWETNRRHEFVWITETAGPDTGASTIWRRDESQENLGFPVFEKNQRIEHLQILRDQEPFHEFIARAPHPDDGNVLSFSGAPFTDDHDQFQGYRGTVHNPTSASRSGDRLLAFAESASDWFWESDEDLRLTYVSEAFDLITGLSRDVWLGQNLRSFTTTPDRDEDALKAHQNDLENHHPFRNHCFAYRRADGEEAWFSISGRPMLDGNANFKGYRGTVKDVSEQIALEKALRGALKDAKFANAAKTEFLSSMSHELRTPLNGVLGFGQLLRMDEDNPLSTVQLEAVDQILNCGNHLLTLIEDVLDLSRIDQKQLVMDITDVPPTVLVEESLAIIRNQLSNSGLELEVRGLNGGADWLVRADLARAKQILLNLLTNAIKYNTTGKHITLTCSSRNNVYLRFEVSDDGPGIPLEKQDSLFQPFNRLGMENKKIEGTGIGLTISKELIELMGGKIGFESAESKGSRFWFDLPMATPSPAAVSSQSIPEILQGKAIPETRALRKILYIEDNPANMMLITMVVQRLNDVELIPAESAEIGLKIAQAELPHLILMDINLPGMNGIEALRELRATPNLRKIPVIAISAAAMPSDIEAGAKAGFDRYITKPIKISDALEAIKKTLDQVDTTPWNAAT
jgi:PAS domain S-box-containing protein